MEEPVYIVKVGGVWRASDMDNLKQRFERELGGRVVVVDARVEDVFQLEPQDVRKLVKLLMNGSGELEEAE